MSADPGRTKPAQDAELIARAVAALRWPRWRSFTSPACRARSVPPRWPGIGYLGIIAAAILAAGAMIARSRWLAWAAARGLAAARHGRLRADPRPVRGNYQAITTMPATGAARWASPRSAWRR